ncbi:MAG: NADH-quinone oxidoreductase subunit B, partial [Bacteroidota bacterium]
MEKKKFINPLYEKRTVLSPDGEEITIDPMQDYFCNERPKTHAPSSMKVVENFLNWARSESLWVLGFGTGCGSIEIYPLLTPRFDAYRFGVQMRPTPRQSNVRIISGSLSVKTLKRV